MKLSEFARLWARKRSVLAATAIAMFPLAASAQLGGGERIGRIIVGYPPGGSTDSISRLIGNAIEPILGQRIIIENRAGLNGVLAAAFVAQSLPDPNVVYQCPMSTLAITPQIPGLPVPIDPGRETVPIANIALSSYGLVVAANSPYKSLNDILAAARAKPGQVTFASPGVGSVQHLSGEYINQLAKVDMLHVPYRGAAPAVVDVLGGRIDFFFTNLGDVAGQIQSGDLRLLGQGDPSRFPTFPDAARISDTLPGFDVLGWFGICGHKDLPANERQRWADAIAKVMKDDAFRKRLQQLGFTPQYEDGPALARRLADDRQRWLGIIQLRNIKAN